MLQYIVAMCIVLLGIALAAIATERNLIVILLAIELIFLASTILIVGFLSYSYAVGAPLGIFALLSVWAVASIEIITLVAFYIFIKTKGYSFDVSELSKMKW